MENRLKVLRAMRDWSQSDLAEKLEVSRQSVNAIETGRYDPSLPARLPHRRAVRPADRGDFRLADAAQLESHLNHTQRQGNFHAHLSH